MFGWSRRTLALLISDLSRADNLNLPARLQPCRPSATRQIAPRFVQCQALYWWYDFRSLGCIVGCDVLTEFEFKHNQPTALSSESCDQK